MPARRLAAPVGLTEGALVCVLAPGTDSGHVDSIREHFEGASEAISVLVERRGTDRRLEQRRRGERSHGSDRRRIRNRHGRRLVERRHSVLVAPPQELAERMGGGLTGLRFFRVETADLASREDDAAAALILRLQAGDRQALDELYVAYFDRVYAYLRVALANAHEAEDATQEVFIRMMKALPRFELQAGSFRAWLFRVARNVALNHHAKHGRVEPEEPDRLNSWREASPLNDGAAERTLHWISDPDLMLLIDRMPLAQRQVITLYHMLGFSCVEIAEILDRSPEAVRQLQQRGYTFLRTRLASLGRRALYAEPPIASRRLRRQALVLRARRFALYA